MTAGALLLRIGGMSTRKGKLAVAVSSVTIVGLLITSLAGYFVSLSSLRSEIRHNELPLTSDNVYSEIQRDLVRPTFVSSLMASDTFLRDWVLQGEKDPGEVTRYLGEIQKKYHTVTSFLVSDKTLLYYHPKGVIKKVSAEDPSDAWYFRVRQSKAEYEINVDRDAANGDAMTIFISYRVYDYKGNYIGATGVGLTVDAVNRMIENYQSQFGRSIIFVDRDGRVRLHGMKFPGAISNIHEMEGLGPIADKVLGASENSLQFRRQGETIHLNSRYIPEFGWYLLVEQNEREAKQRIWTTFLINLLICGVISFVVVRLTRMTIHSYQERVERMASTDKLTGLYNRQAFDLMFEAAVAEAGRDGTPFALLSLDLDHFKEINDTYGHQAGDAVLERTARILQAGVRSSDSVFRWGGEEFLVLLRKCPKDAAMLVGDKLRTSLKLTVTTHDGREIRITVSAGVADYHNDESGKDLIKRADQALYEAKRLGRDRVVASEG